MKHREHYKKKSEFEWMGNAEKKIERKVEKKVMENKSLVIAIGIVFTLAIVLGMVLFLDNSAKGESVSEQCANFCGTEQKAAFCDVSIKVTDTFRAKCNALATNPAYSKYNVEPCDSISCVLTEEESDNTCVSGLGGVWESPVGETCEPLGDAKRIVLSSTDSPPIEGQVCCSPVKYLE